MAEEDTRVFVPDPTPIGMDPEVAEWILRQFYRINGSSSEVTIRQDAGEGELDRIGQDLDAHIQNQTNPHATRHDNLADGQIPIAAHFPAGGDPGQVAAKASAADYDLVWENLGVTVKGEGVPGTGTVQDDVNAHCFSGPYSDGSCRMCIGFSDMLYIGHAGILYLYVGPDNVCIGSGGAGGIYPHHVTVASDFVPSGTTSHTALSNRDAADSHPQAAVGGRGAQATLEADQVNQDSRITTLEAHPPRNDNPHQVTHAQLPDKGVNNHAAIDAHITSTTNPHQVRHEQLSDRGTNDHAAIDAHIADALIHFQDVPVDGIGYVRLDRTWVNATNIALLGGSPTTGTLGTGGLILTGWPLEASSGLMDGAQNAAAGTITVPVAGWYEIVVHVYGNQGNDTKEESIWLELEAPPNSGWAEVAHESVDTDKTSGRSLSFTAARELSAGAVVRARLRASAGLGTFVFDACTFVISKLI